MILLITQSETRHRNMDGHLPTPVAAAGRNGDALWEPCVQANSPSPENRVQRVQANFRSPVNPVQHVQANSQNLATSCGTCRPVLRVPQPRAARAARCQETRQPYAQRAGRSLEPRQPHARRAGQCHEPEHPLHHVQGNFRTLFQGRLYVQPISLQCITTKTKKGELNYGS